MIDITEQKEREESLLRSKKKLREISLQLNLKSVLQSVPQNW